MKASRVAALLALVLLGSEGCIHKKRVATEPVAPPPPELTSTFPAARSRGALLETEIWAQFRTPLDPTTVNSRNVALELDTQYIPAAISWDTAVLRIRIRPLAPLLILRTYTVRLEPGLATNEGRALGTSYFWQFRTSGVRTPIGPYPPDRAEGESPFAALSWDSTGVPSGLVIYEIYTGTDSAAIAARSVVQTGHTHHSYFVPGFSWGFGTRFWSITTYNPSTGEQSAGPVWRFDTLPRETPIDSVTVALSDWGDYVLAEDLEECFERTFHTGPRYKTAIRWDLAHVGPHKLAGALIRLGYIPGGGPGFPSPTLYPCLDYWNACGILFPGPPHVEANTFLAFGRLGDPGQMLLTSPALTAHLEAMLRRPGFFGYALVGPEASYMPDACSLTLRWYREAAQAESGMEASRSQPDRIVRRRGS